MPKMGSPWSIFFPLACGWRGREGARERATGGGGGGQKGGWSERAILGVENTVDRHRFRNQRRRPVREDVEHVRKGFVEKPGLRAQG